MQKIFQKKSCVSISPNGPYLVSNLPLDEAIMICTNDGSPVDWKKGKKLETAKTYSLCRCGHSKNKPFCSGEHFKIGFDGTETASNEKFSKNVQKTIGSKLTLLDNGEFCNHSGFCTVGLGVWDSVMYADDKNSKDKAVKQVVQKILDNEGKVLQAEVSRLEGLGKVKSHRVIQRLIDRGVIEKESFGKTNIIKLNKEIKETLLAKK